MQIRRIILLGFLVISGCNQGAGLTVDNPEMSVADDGSVAQSTDLAMRPDLSVLPCLNNAQCMNALPHATGACGSALTCVIASCDAGYADCDKVAANGCEVALDTDLMNCNACGASCATVLHGTGRCAAGKCVIASCNPGFGNCDGLFATGCSVATSADIMNCGACGRSCSAPNGTPSCKNGMCGIASCVVGYADCDMNAADGCEAQLTSDPMNCGGCMNSCMAPPNAMVSCSMSTCAVGLCGFGYADCDKDPTDGCEVNVAVDLGNCGACGMQCVTPVNGTAACKTGVCGIGTCNAMFGDCDMNPANGCEKSLATDLNNCGACGTACSFANAAGACLNGNCGISACNPGYADCDKNGNNGCEVASQSDAKNCGKCGTVCPTTKPACVGGTCAASLLTLSFDPPVTYKAGTTPVCPAVADLNGDGKLDLAVTDAKGSLLLLFGNGDGTFAAQPSLTTLTANYVVAGDFNGDKKVDLAVTNDASDEISVFLNGVGGFQPRVDYPAPNSGVSTWIVTGDFNGDQAIDLAVSGRGSAVTMLLNKGDGTFGVAVPYGLGLSQGLVSADFNRDGKLDIAVAIPNTIDVYLGNGDGTLNPPTSYQSANQFALAAADWDADGSIDLAATGSMDNNVSIFLNTGHGAFQAPVNYPGGQYMTSLAAADFNMDGKPDLVASAYYGKSIGIYANAGSGTFQTPLSYPTGGQARTAQVGDFNRDGLPDIVVTDEMDGAVLIFLNASH